MSGSIPDRELVTFAANMTITSNSQRRSATKNGVKTGYSIEKSENEGAVKNSYPLSFSKNSFLTYCIITELFHISIPSTFKLLKVTKEWFTTWWYACIIDVIINISIG